MRQSFLKSVNCSVNGLKFVVTKERNFKLQLIAAICILLLGWEAKLSRIEWAILFLTVSFVLSMELLNTCIEKIMDLLHPNYSEKVKTIKDMAAAAVMLSALFSLAIGITLFYKLFI